MKIGRAGANTAAAARTERDDSLAGKIIAFEERADNPGGLDQTI